jgi:hypothetical protein
MSKENMKDHDDKAGLVGNEGKVYPEDKAPLTTSKQRNWHEF